LLLSLKDKLHALLKRLTAEELSGTLKLLFISVVLLPVLPNQGYGPWAFFNPYLTWWMVVLIAALGFSAYLAIRLIGSRKGLLLTAVLGGPAVQAVGYGFVLWPVGGNSVLLLIAALVFNNLTGRRYP
ncbi:HPP family protein, partial [Enterobacter hormaechei]|uniref:HPP family protein n=1 Tax=Enterobacter hormaechei TaxID=158836 RepID=UPI0019545473